MNVWISLAIGVLVALFGVVYYSKVRRGGSGMHRAAPVIIALAVLGIAINELVVIPQWGVEVGTSVSSVYFWCMILPLAAYLSTHKTR